MYAVFPFGKPSKIYFSSFNLPEMVELISLNTNLIIQSLEGGDMDKSTLGLSSSQK